MELTGEDDRGHLDTIDDAFRVQIRSALCFHEAGHVVAMWVVGVKAGATHVRPIEDRFEGLALYSIEGCHGVTLRTLIMTAAGPIASRSWDGTVHDGGEQDRADIERGLRTLCRSTEAADIVRRHVEAEARRIVNQNWDGVEAIAEALRARSVLTGDEVSEIMTDLEHRRGRERWREIEARHQSNPTTNTRATE